MADGGSQKGVDAHDSAGVAANAASLKAGGYSFAAQYIDQNAATEDGPPGITPTQAQTDIAAGLTLVSIYETSSLSSTNYQTGASQYGWQGYLTEQQGQTDAAEAFSSAVALGQPSGSAIYFAMDFDPAATQGITEAQALARIDSYFQGIQDYIAAHPGGPSFKIGVYGAGDTLASVVRQNGLAQYGWLTQSTGWAGSGAGNPNAQGWSIVQGAGSTFNGTAVDLDTTASGDFGAWPVCFGSGTLISTARGDVAVEALRVGDLAVTAAGGLRPITWTGHRVLSGEGQALPHDQQPIRIRAGAFGRDALGSELPQRDLLLSPGHPVLVGADADNDGGHLVPAMCLVNGITVERVAVESVTYWHVELDAHDILLAEGLPAESYLDWSDRAFFLEASDHALANPDFVVPGLAGRCRPVAVDGPVVEAERRRLDAVFAAALTACCAWDEASIAVA